MLEKTEALTKESGPDTNEAQTVHNIYLLIDATNMIAEGGETIAECWNISKRGRNIMSIIFSHGRKRIHRHEPAVNVLKQQQQTKRPIPSLEGATSNLTTIHITTASEGAFGLNGALLSFNWSTKPLTLQIAAISLIFAHHIMGRCS